VKPERWQEVKEVLAAALERAPRDRAAYLDQACTDPSMRREVESLIIAHGQSDSTFMEEPAMESPSNETLKSGSRLGSYEIIARIGAGGMGVVYSARDTTLGRTVAIKVLPNAFLHDSQRLARFQREARVLASLNHPNISIVHGLEQSGSTSALVMELVEGPTLADRIRQGPIPIEEALPIARQICEALEYAHEHGMVHRDLKPANVKVTSGDAVKVLDFGLAKAIQGDGSEMDPANSPTISAMATQAGVLLGTAAYMSPEQAKGKAVDRRADIWAFGCVLYEMLAGKMAFRGESVTDTLAAVIKEEPDWSQLPAATPIRVRVLLQRCLRKDPKQRLRDIGDARISLDEVLTDAPQDASFGTVATPAMQRLLRLAWRVVAASCLVALAVAFVRFREKPAAPAEEMRLQISLPVKPVLRLAGMFALSPDGRHLAFAASSVDGIPRVWIRAMNSLEMRPLPGSESVGTLLFWSPDSRFIAFDAGGKLQKIDISGGPAETVCVLSGTVVGGSWSNDGVIIYGQWLGTIMRVSAAGGVATPLTALDALHGDVAHTVPWFLPDGRHFIYLRDMGTNGVISIGSLDVKPEEQDSRRLVETGSAAVYAPSSDPDSGQLLFRRGAALMAQPFDARRLNLSGEPTRVVEEPIGTYLDYSLFSVSANGILAYWPSGNGDSQLTWFDLQGKILSTVGEPGPYVGLALSPDGTRAVVSKRSLPSGNVALWQLDLSRDTSMRFDLGSSINDLDAVWAADGRRIIFTSDRSGMMDLYEKPLSDAGHAEALLKTDEWKWPQSWSPDGRFLLYLTVGRARGGALWVLPLGDHQKPMPFLKTESDEGGGRFSPDGNWVAYASDESGRPEVYVRRFSPDAVGEAMSEAGDKVLISNGGGSEPSWRQDGKELYYIDPDRRLMEVNVTAGRAFQASAPSVLFQAPPRSTDEFGVPQWGPSPDGKRFLFLVPETRGDVPFTVALNWQGGLKK